jgi:hypothetical protein
MSGLAGIEDVVDELLALPPQQFTEARNAAAKRLTADGRRDEAAELKRLSRPSPSLWALNRLAREQGSLLKTFLSAAEALRKAHRSGGDIRAATAPERAAEAEVTAAAAELLRADGSKATETVMRGLRQILSAAAADAQVAAALRDGRLLREPDAPSLDDLLGSLAQDPGVKPASAPKKRNQDAQRRALQEKIAEAKNEASQARTEAREAADAARAAQREWERAQKAAEGTQRCSDAAAERLQELQLQLKEP